MIIPIIDAFFRIPWQMKYLILSSRAAAGGVAILSQPKHPDCFH